jgi:2-oxoglutarate dehydrogenase E2 component (dihydrolipoamide succinyltransferase)
LASPVTLPQLGETVVEGTITKWLKQQGDKVERDEPLFEISTDKVDTEVPSPLAGTLVEIKVQEGETVGVGTEVALIDTDGSGGGSSDGEASQEKESAAPAEEGEETAKEVEPQEAEPAKAEAATAEKSEEAEPKDEEPAGDTGQAVAARADQAQESAEVAAGGSRNQILSPLVRRLAEENQIDLGKVQGTGTGGRVTKKDVMAFLESGGPAKGEQDGKAEAPAAQAEPAQPKAQEQPAAATKTGEREEAIPLTRMRQSIAKHMVASIQTSARAWNLVEVNMENIVRVRNAAKDAFKEREGLSLTYMPFVAKAVCDALLAFPEVNAELRDEQLIMKSYVNLGIAVALDTGLIVPVIKDADAMNITGLARAVNDIATKARTKKLMPDDVHGSTFTITNPGPFGSIISMPIINQPNCAILAFDAVEKRAVVVDDAIAIRHMVYLSMSWDHRIIDGATAAKFLGRLKQNLETWDFGPEVGLPAKGAPSE